MRNVLVVAVFALWAGLGCVDENNPLGDAGHAGDGGGDLRDSGSEVAADAGQSSDAGAEDAGQSDAGRDAAAAPDDDAQVAADSGQQTELADGESLALSFRVVDAEYSSQLERIVIVAAEPNLLIVLDPETGKHEDVQLPLTPSAVSVHPDGRSAVVAHNAYVSVVQLAPASRSKVVPVTADVSDIVLASNGYAYAFPRVDQWVGIHSIQLDTEVETVAGSIWAQTTARLHPGGDRIYGANRGLSPADIERYDVSAGPAAMAYDSPYHGDYEMCGDLWITADGKRIVTACGNVFRASNVRDDDMKYNGALQDNPTVRHLSHSSAAKLLAVLPRGPTFFLGDEPSTAPRQLLLFEDEFLNRRQSLMLPQFEAGGQQFASEGRFVFFRSDGSRLYALVEAESEAPIVNNFALVRYSVRDGDVKGGSPIMMGGMDGDDMPDTATVTGAMQLDYNVVDAEYSRVLDRIVALTAEENQLLVIDPKTGDAEAVELSLPGATVGIKPDGLQAAVGHNGWITVIDLQAKTVLDMFEVATDVLDVVLASNGYAYALPVRDQWASIYSVNLTTGMQTTSTGTIYAGTVARLHPAGNRMYGANRGLSPSDIERYDLGTGTANISYDSPYHGDYDMCGDLWFSEDGARIFTACGNVFRASDVREMDMTYNGALPGAPFSVLHLDHSVAAQRVAAARATAGTVVDGTSQMAPGEVLLFEDEFLNASGKLSLPGFELSGGGTVESEARWVFFDAAGENLYVIARAPAEAEIDKHFMLATFEL